MVSFGLPLQGGGGYPKIVVEIKVKENCWKHQKRKCSNQILVK